MPFVELQFPGDGAKELARVGRPVVLVEFGCGGETSHAASLVRSVARFQLPPITSARLSRSLPLIYVAYSPCGASHGPELRTARRIAEGLCEGAVSPRPRRALHGGHAGLPVELPRRTIGDQVAGGPGANPRSSRRP